jgi:peptidoglycan/LPS O-acetylase OafA/YrhL
VRYRPEIDGLRAVAVIPVILFHAGYELFSGGFVGVDVFFVISGYLITTIILTEKEAGQFRLGAFYERRARRILPALFFIIAVSIPFAWLWLMPSEMTDFSRSVATIPIFSSNILFWLESGYFDTASELKPLLHTWSLAVEEQYYILFPLFLMLIWNFGKQKVVLILAAAAVVSLALAEYGSARFPEATFFLLPTRAWELLIGVFAAFYSFFKRDIRGSQTLSMIGLALILYSIFAFDEETPFPSLNALVPTLGAAMVILFASSDTIANRLLRLKPLVAIGLISYSAYLWHQPVLALARHSDLDIEGRSWILVTLVIILSYFTWKYVERPFRNRRIVHKSAVVPLALSSSVFVLIIGLTGHFMHGFPERSTLPYTANISNYEFDNKELQRESWTLLEALAGGNNYGVDGNAFDHELWFAAGEKKKLLLVGNSHAKDLYNALRTSESAQDNFQLARYGEKRISCLEDPESPFYKSPNYLSSDLIMIAPSYSERDCAGYYDTGNSDTDALPLIIQRMKSDGKVPIIVGQSLKFPTRSDMEGIGSPTLSDVFLREFLGAHSSPTASDLASAADSINRIYFQERQFNDEINRELRNIALTNNVLFLDRTDYLCHESTKRCFGVSADLTKHFFDVHHTTLAGAQFFGKRIDALQWLQPLLN